MSVSSIWAREIAATMTYCVGCVVAVIAISRASNQREVNDWAVLEGWDKSTGQHASERIINLYGPL